VFPVRYKFNLYIAFRRNSFFKGSKCGSERILLKASEWLLCHHDNALCRGWQRKLIRSMTECLAVDVHGSPLGMRTLRIPSSLLQFSFLFKR
jgi:hypothetical protein